MVVRGARRPRFNSNVDTRSVRGSSTRAPACTSGILINRRFHAIAFRPLQFRG